MSINSDRLREFFNSDVTDAAADELDELEEKLAASEARVGVLEKDAAIGQLVRKKLVSGNSIPVERCVIRADEVAAISGNKKECGDAAQILA